MIEAHPPMFVRYSVEVQYDDGTWKCCLVEPFHWTLEAAEKRKSEGDPSMQHRIVKETTTFEVVG